MAHAGRLAAHVAVVTGAGSGLGAAAAALFARQGAKVVCADLDPSAAAKTAEQINKEVGLGGVVAVGFGADVAKGADAEGMVRCAEESFGKLTVLLNNAGVMLPGDDDACNTDEATVDKTLAVNVKGVLNGCKHAVPAMRRAGHGSIVNVASFVALMGAATPQVAYTASKGAVLALTRELAVVHAREGIRVNALCPGPLQTELLMKFLDDDAKKHRRLVHVPMGRFGLAHEMAQGALFLASDESSFMTGAPLVMDGGITAAYVTPE